MFLIPQEIAVLFSDKSGNRRFGPYPEEFYLFSFILTGWSILNEIKSFLIDIKNEIPVNKMYFAILWQNFKLI